MILPVENVDKAPCKVYFEDWSCWFLPLSHTCVQLSTLKSSWVFLRINISCKFGLWILILLLQDRRRDRQKITTEHRRGKHVNDKRCKELEKEHGLRTKPIRMTRAAWFTDRCENECGSAERCRSWSPSGSSDTYACSEGRRDRCALTSHRYRCCCCCCLDRCRSASLQQQHPQTILPSNIHSFTRNARTSSKWYDTTPTSIPVLLILGQESTLVEWRAAPWWVTLSMRRLTY